MPKPLNTYYPWPAGNEMSKVRCGAIASCCRQKRINRELRETPRFIRNGKKQPGRENSKEAFLAVPLAA
jgi:hypothetical protein